eukprot:3474896-Rhodomonas_salina.1
MCASHPLFRLTSLSCGAGALDAHSQQQHLPDLELALRVLRPVRRRSARDRGSRRRFLQGVVWSYCVHDGICAGDASTHMMPCTLLVCGLSRRLYVGWHAVCGCIIRATFRNGHGADTHGETADGCGGNSQDCDERRASARGLVGRLARSGGGCGRQSPACFALRSLCQ